MEVVALFEHVCPPLLVGLVEHFFLFYSQLFPLSIFSP